MSYSLSPYLLNIYLLVHYSNMTCPIIVGVFGWNEHFQATTLEFEGLELRELDASSLKLDLIFSSIRFLPNDVTQKKIEVSNPNFTL